MTEEELYGLAGTKRAGLLSDLTCAKLIERKGEVYVLHSPALLSVAMRLEAAGIDSNLGVAASEVLRKHLSRAAKDLVELFVKRSDEFLGDRDAGETVSTLRPVGMEAVRVLFGREMERELRTLFESGKFTAEKSPKRHHAGACLLGAEKATRQVAIFTTSARLETRQRPSAWRIESSPRYGVEKARRAFPPMYRLRREAEGRVVRSSTWGHLRADFGRRRAGRDSARDD